MSEIPESARSKARRQLMEKFRAEKKLKTKVPEAAGAGGVKRRKSSHKPGGEDARRKTAGLAFVVN